MEKRRGKGESERRGKWREKEREERSRGGKEIRRGKWRKRETMEVTREEKLGVTLKRGCGSVGVCLRWGRKGIRRALHWFLG